MARYVLFLVAPPMHAEQSVTAIPTHATILAICKPPPLAMHAVVVSDVLAACLVS